MTHLFLALIVGFGVGIVVGALGAGGGILSVPVLVYLLGQEPHAASAGSLVIVGLTAVVSLMPRAREGHVRWRDGLVFGVVSSVGNVLGSRASLMVDAHMLMILFSVLLMAVGVFMVRKSCRMSQVVTPEPSRMPIPVPPTRIGPFGCWWHARRRPAH